MQNTFTGANLKFPNEGIHNVLATIAKFRKQLTPRNEFKQQSGWNNEMNRFMQDGLQEIGNSVNRIVYNPDTPTVPQTTLEKNAADTSRTLKMEFDGKSLNSDNVLMPTNIDREVVHKLDGTDPNMPQPTPELFPNDHGRVFIAGLDRLFVELTRLDSRFDPTFITKYEGVMIFGLLNKLWSMTEVYGGEVNRVDTPNGTLPADEPLTFGNGGAQQK